MICIALIWVPSSPLKIFAVSFFIGQSHAGFIFPLGPELQTQTVAPRELQAILLFKPADTADDLTQREVRLKLLIDPNSERLINFMNSDACAEFPAFSAAPASAASFPINPPPPPFMLLLVPRYL